MTDARPDPPPWQAVMLDGLMEAYAGARPNGDPFDFTASSMVIEAELASCHEQWLKLREPSVPKCGDCRFAFELDKAPHEQCVHPSQLLRLQYEGIAATEMRTCRDFGDCGPEGKLFEAKS